MGTSCSENNIFENNVRLVRNTIAMYSRTFVVMFVSLYITRAILKVLGTEDYGIYNLVGSVVVLFSFLSSSLTQGIHRFITIELGKKDFSSLNRIFCISVLAQLLIAAIILVLCETIGLYILNNYLNIGARIKAANLLFHFSLLTFVVNILRAPFEAVVIAHEKMTFFAIISIIDVFLKLFIVLMLGYVQSDKLILYSFSLCIVSCLSFIMYWQYCKRNFKETKFYFYWDKERFVQLISFSGWNLCGSITNVATLNVFGFLLNIFYGLIANAALGIANQVNAAVNQFIANFQTSFRPQIVKAYASQQEHYFKKLIGSASKFSFLLIFIPCLLLITNMPLILSVWLGDYPMHTVAFCRLILVCCLFDGLTGSFYCGITAIGNIKFYQVAISLSFILDLISSFLLMYFGMDVEYILYSRIATRGIINMCIGLFVLNRLINYDVIDYLKSYFIPCLGYSVILSLLCYILTFFVSEWYLFLYSLSTVLLVSFISLRFVFTVSERNNIQLIWKKIWS